MLAAGRRLRRRDEFTSAIRAGRRAGRGGLVVHLALPVTGEPTGSTVARAGFIVPKTVGSAVVRNKVRRRLRHLVRDRLELFPAGTDLVIRVLPEATGRTYRQLGADLDAAVGAARTTGRAPGRLPSRLRGQVATGGRADR